MAIAPLVPSEVTTIAIHRVTGCDTAAQVDRMQRDKGLIRIGYHYVIRQDGVVEPGRSLTQRGSHLPDRNHCSVGIAVLGTDSEVDVALECLLEYLSRRFGDLEVEDYR